MPLTSVQDLADTRLAQKISAAAGRRPGQPSAAASGRRCASEANPQALAAYGLNIDDLRTTISNANVNTPKGNFDGPTRRLHDQRQRPAAERRGLSRHSSSPTRTARRCGCATSPRSTRRPRTPSCGAWINATPAVILLNVQRQPGANVIEVVDQIKALLPQLRASAARRRSTSRSLTDRTGPSAPRWTTCSSSCCSPSCWSCW